MSQSRIFVMCVMALVVLVSPTLFAQQEGTSVPLSEIATVIWVHDGDTITVLPCGSHHATLFLAKILIFW